jgi:hypothetical protein
MLTVAAPGAVFTLIMKDVVTVDAIMAAVIAVGTTVTVIIVVMAASGLAWVGDILILAFTSAPCLSDTILSIGILIHITIMVVYFTGHTMVATRLRLLLLALQYQLCLQMRNQ